MFSDFLQFLTVCLGTSNHLLYINGKFTNSANTEGFINFLYFYSSPIKVKETVFILLYIFFLSLQSY